MSTAALFVFAIVLLLVAPRIFLPPQPKSEFQGLLKPMRWLNSAYCFFWHRLDAEHAPLPKHGPVLVIANHTCAIDHTLLMATSNRVLSFLIAKQFYDDRFFGTISKILKCIPVKRDGQDLGATRAAIRALESGRAVAIFPEGRISQHSGRHLLPGKAGVGFIALKSKVPVIPAFIYGAPCSNQFWPCLATSSQTHVLYGPPVDLADLIAHDGGRDDIQVATDRLMGALRDLQTQARERDPAWWNVESQPISDPDPVPAT